MLVYFCSVLFLKKKKELLWFDKGINFVFFYLYNFSKGKKKRKRKEKEKENSLPQMNRSRDYSIYGI